MDISVGLPSHVPGVKRSDIIAWARRAEELGFASLVATDRFAWDQLDPLTVLATAGAVTDTIRLRTSVMLLPNRGASGPLAKQIATLQHMVEGRLELGVGVGDRDIDYRLADGQHRGRHRRLEVMLEELASIWAGEGEYAVMGPRPDRAISIMVGGTGEKAWERVAKYASGWTFAVGSPDDFAAGVKGVRDTWLTHGRSGVPRVAAQRYFNVTEQQRPVGEQFIRDYFGFLGPAVDYLIAASPLDGDSVLGVAEAFRQAGADELAMLPTSTDLGELERLAELTL